MKLFKIFRVDNKDNIAAVWAFTSEVAIQGFRKHSACWAKDVEVYTEEVELLETDWSIEWNDLA